MEKSQERSLDDVDEMLHLAKLSENDMVMTSQAVFFTDENLYDHNYKLLELDRPLLENLKEGQTLFIKGNDDENVVMCSNNRTYDVIGAETSNSLLLVENMNFFEDVKDASERSVKEVKVSGIFCEYLIITPSKPHLTKLKELLQKSLYKGPEHEYEIKQEDLFSYEDLTKIIQASDLELKKALENMTVVKIDNKIRLLDFEYHFRVLSYMLKLIEENSWPLDEIDFDETLNSLKDIVPEAILLSLFEKYTVESKIIDGLQLYSYKEEEIAKFFAQVLLYGAGKFNLDEFLQAWSESVPEGMQTSEELLHGIAIIDRNKTPNVIYAFSEENLCDDINERFNQLFNAKEKWSVPEITPYIQPLTTEKLDANALLAKYARASTVNGVKYYSAKHGK